MCLQTAAGGVPVFRTPNTSAGRGGKESALCAFHLLPVFICCAAAGAGEDGAGLHVFLCSSATLSPGRWGRRREVRRTERSAGDVKPDPASSFLASSSSSATSPESRRDSQSNLIPLLQTGNALTEGEVEEGRKRKKWREGRER